MMRARPFLLMSALALVSACASCASDITPIDLAHAQLRSGIDVAEGRAAVPPEPTAQNCGDPTVSVRPPGRLPAAKQMPAGSTMAKIVKRGTLIAGVDQTTDLFGARNPISEQFEGFDIDVVHDIAASLLGDPNAVQFKVVSSAQREKVLQDGSVDVVVRTMTINCARKKDIAFSAVYYQANQRLLVSRTSGINTLQDATGKKICAAEGSTSLNTFLKSNPKAVPVSVKNWSDCLALLQGNQVAGVSTDDSILAGMQAQDPNLVVVGPVLAKEPYGVGVPKKNTDMVAFVNGVLEKRRAEGKFTGSYNKWLGPRLGKAPAPPVPNYGQGKGAP